MPRKIPKRVQERISRGIEKEMHEYKRTGKITTDRATYRPKSKAAAAKQAAAIEYGKARSRGAKVPKKRTKRT